MEISEEEIEWMYDRQNQEHASFLFVLDGLQVKGTIQSWAIDNGNNFVVVKKNNDEFWFLDLSKVIAIQELYHEDKELDHLKRRNE